MDCVVLAHRYCSTVAQWPRQDMKNLVVVDDNHTPLAAPLASVSLSLPGERSIKLQLQVMTRFAFLAWRVADRLAFAKHR